MQSTCSIEGCEKASEKRSWCGMHYRRWQRHGDPLATSKIIDPDRGCSVDDCDRKHYAKGWCQKHWHHAEMYGHPVVGTHSGRRQLHTPSVAERFFARVRQGENGCWTWHKVRSDNGYGTTFGPSRGVKTRPHRWAYEYLRAEIPAGLVLDHLCENRGCVNPWHLEPVTQRINVLRARRRKEADRVPSWAA